MATVDERIVRLKMDNSDFQSKIGATITGLEKLKSATKVDGAAASLKKLDDAAKNINFDGATKSAETLHAKFSTLGVAGAAAIGTLASKVASAGLHMVKSLAIDPILQGYDEYQNQLNSVQTILANTASKGENIKTVNAALDELNKYADQTIYNFGQMTSNIGYFTAAGVGLKESVANVKGLANAAALQGANATQAAGATYQMSQAIAAGTVRLQDWMSMERASMGGEAIQEALKRTARVHGIAVDQMIEKNGSFRLSLQENWLTAEIFNETMAQLAGDYSDEQLRQMGYNEEQIAQIQELARTAMHAAQDIKTIPQLMDVVFEEIGSGWAQTFRIIFGDFEEAKELLTAVGTSLQSVIGKFSDARNAMFQTWKDLGGRTAIIEGFKNLIMAIVRPIQAIGTAFGQVFKGNLGSVLATLSKGFQALTSKLVLTDSAMAKLTDIFKGVFSVIHVLLWPVQQLGKLFLALAAPILNAAYAIAKFVAGGILSLAAGIGRIINSFDRWLTQFDPVGKLIGWVADKLKDLIRRFDELTGGKVGKFFQALGGDLNKVSETLSTVSNAADFTKLGDSFESIGSKASTAKDKVVDFAKSIGSAFKQRFFRERWNLTDQIGGPGPQDATIGTFSQKNFETIRSMEQLKQLFSDIGSKWKDVDNTTLWEQLTYTTYRLSAAIRGTAIPAWDAFKKKVSEVKEAISKWTLDDLEDFIADYLRRDDKTLGLADAFDKARFSLRGLVAQAKEMARTKFGIQFDGSFTANVNAAKTALAGYARSAWEVIGPKAAAAWDVVKEAAVAFGMAVAAIGGGAIAGIKEVFQSIDWNNIGESIKRGAEHLREFAERARETTQQGIGATFEAIGSGASKAASKVKELSTAMGGKFMELFRKWGNDIRVGAEEWGIPEKFEKIKQHVLDLKAKVPDALDWIGDKFHRMGEKIKEGLKWAYDSLMGVNAWDALLKGSGVAAITSFILLLRNFRKNMKQFGTVFEEISKTISEVRGPIVKTINAYKDSLKAATRETNANAVLKLAAATLVLAIALGILALIPTDRLLAASVALGVIFGVIIGAWAVFNHKGKTQAKETTDLVDSFKKGFTNGLKDLGSSIKSTLNSIGKSFEMGGLLALAGAILLVAAAVMLLSKLDTEELIKGLIAITVITGVMTAAAKIMAAGDNVAKGSGQFVLMAAAMLGFYWAVKGFGDMDTTQLIKGTAALIAVIGALTLFSNKGSKLSLGNGIALLAVAMAAKKIAGVVEEFAAKPWDEWRNGTLKMSITIGILVTALSILPDDALYKAGLLLAVAIVMHSMASTIGRYASMPWTEYLKGVLLMAATLAILVAAVTMLGSVDSVKGAASLLILAGALVVIAGALEILGNLSAGQAVIGILALAAGLAVLIAAAYAAQSVTVVILALAAGIALIGIAVGVASLGLAAFVVAFTGLLALVLTGGVALIAMIPLLATAIAQGFINILTVIGQNGPAIEMALTAIITGCLNALRNSLPDFFSLVQEAIIGMAQTIDRTSPVIIATGIRLILRFLSAIRDNIGEITQIAIDIIVRFIDTISANLPRIIQSGVDLLISFLEGIARAIRENKDRVANAALDIGDALVEGVKRGIELAWERLKAKVAEMADMLPNWLKDKLGIHSPSRVTTEIGEFVGLGLVQGIGNSSRNVDRAAESFAQRSKDSLNEAFRAIVSDLEGDPEFNPTITIDVDDSEARDSLRELDRLFMGQASTARDAVNQPRYAEVQNGSQNGNPVERPAGDIKFEQNIYSPTAPTRYEIRRDTAELLERMKRMRS